MGFSKLRTRSHVRITFSVSLYLCNGYYTLPYFDRTIKFFRLDELLLLLLFFYKYGLRCALCYWINGSPIDQFNFKQIPHVLTLWVTFCEGLKLITKKFISKPIFCWYLKQFGREREKRWLISYLSAWGRGPHLCLKIMASRQNGWNKKVWIVQCDQSCYVFLLCSKV